MKTIPILLFLSPFFLSAQFKLVYFNIKTVNDKGKILPNCELGLLASGCMGTSKFTTDNQGNCIIPFYASKHVSISATQKWHHSNYIMFRDLDKIPEGDTLSGTITLRLYVPPASKSK